MLEFEVHSEGKRPCFRVLMPDGEVRDFSAPAGPGVWYKIMQQILDAIPGTTPEDFDNKEEVAPGQWPRFYYEQKSEALRGKPELMEKYGFFECQQCHTIYSKWQFKCHVVCDNCQWRNSGYAKDLEIDPMKESLQ